MKTILIRFPGHGNGALFDEAARDDVLEPFIRLRRRLRDRGYALETADDRPVAGSERILFWDWDDDLEEAPPLRRLARAALRLPRAALRRACGRAAGPPPRPLFTQCVRAGMRDRTVLFVGEPPVVLPRNWDSDVHDRFPTVFTWSDALADGQSRLKFRWPIAAGQPPAAPVAFAEKKLLVAIAADKTSADPRALYAERRRAIRHFERSAPDDFDLYGVGWDGGRDPGGPWLSWRGTVRHKREVYPRYRFALCYENMRDAPGWITEKIFDCMRADCVPVYLGASNVADEVDAAAFVDRRRFASDEDLERYLRGVEEREYAHYREAIADYLAGPRCAAFLSPAFADTVIDGLRLP